MKLSFILLLVCGTLTGCASNPVSVIDERKYADLKGKCYQLVKDSILYELPSCANNDGTCFGIQALGTWQKVEQNVRPVPDSAYLLELRQELWEKRLNQRLRWSLLSGKTEITDILRRGDVFYLTDITYEDFGSLGYKLVIQMTLNDLSGKKVELPSSNHLLLKPYWTDVINGKLEFDSSFVKQCDDDEKN